MKVCGFIGASGVGKTTLIEGVIRELKALGARVSVVKHAHKGFDIDTPGKDSHRVREAGAFEVMLACDRRLALLREYELPAEPSVHQLLAELVDCDWVLVEGFKHADIPKVELWREGSNLIPLYPADPFVFALVTDRPERLPEPTQRPVFAMSDAVAVADYLRDHADRFEYECHG
jgi:molybdopterin-guanine dinucleotide biosynthesis protein B